ncbi:MAG: acyltransferase family protein, partial [Flavisolibacter sp.]
SLRKNKDAGPFYKRRFIRLYPPYITALLWAMLVFGIIRWLMPQLTDGTYATPNLDRLKDSNQLYNWKVILQNLFYLPQLDGILRPFWSLTMEVIFYLLAPYVFRNKKIYFISSIILFLAAMAFSHFNWKPNTIVHNFMYFNIFFAIGVALYDNFDRALEKLKIFKTYKAPLIAIGIFFAMIWVSLIITDETIPSFMAAVMSMILIIYLLSNNLQIKWLIGVGRFSYTLYITHLPTVYLYMMLFFMITPAEPPYIYSSVVFIPCVFFCLGIAYLQYLLVEKRSKMVLDKLRGNKGKEKVVEKVAAF